MDALHAHGWIPGGRRADHRARRRVLPRGREREALSGRTRRALLREHRLLVRRGDRPGRARADAGAAVLHQLVVRASAGDRAGGRGRLARSRRPEPRVLLLRWLGGGRVGLEARAPVLRRAGRKGDRGGRRRGPDAPRRADRGERRAGRIATRRSPATSRTTGRRWARSRSPGFPGCASPSSRSFPRCGTSRTRTATTGRPRRRRRSSRGFSCRSWSRRSSPWAPRPSASCTWSPCRTRAAPSRLRRGTSRASARSATATTSCSRPTR